MTLDELIVKAIALRNEDPSNGNLIVYMDADRVHITEDLSKRPVYRGESKEVIVIN